MAASNLNDLVNIMLSGKYIRAKEWRRAIDRNTFIRQRFSMQKEYVTRFENFANAAKEADRVGGGKTRFQFEEQTYTAEAALKTVASVNNRSGKYGRANFKSQAYMLKKLFPELAEGQELGHKNISVLRASIASVLNKMEKSDERRSSLAALYAIVLKIDEIQEEGEKSLDDILSDLEKSIAKGYSVKASYKKDVNILSGVRGSLELEWEPKDINQFKGRLAGAVGEIFRDVITGNIDAIEQLFKKEDITKIKSSPSMLDDIEKQLVDTIDPKKKQRKSKSSSKVKKDGGGTKVKLKRPKRKNIKGPTTRAAPSNVSLIRLIGVLNQQLPKVVAGNMESPRLNYRTGRFASSVRVTDITETAKGFPSIGYTYMKYPYQTFEPGYAQGDVNRDPRKLIDLSIREIAAQFAIGRFYTRRV